MSKCKCTDCKCKNKELKCKKHPKYKVLREPSGTCVTCWQMWNRKNEPITEPKEPTTIAMEELAAGLILGFCENLAELGCPRNDEPDMWFRNLELDEMIKVTDKLLTIMQRDYK